MFNHLLVSSTLLNLVGMPMAVFMVSGTVVILLTIPLFCVAQLTFLVCKWRPLFLCSSLSLSFDDEMKEDSFFGDNGPLGLFCCCWATIVKVCSSGVLSDGRHNPWLERLVYLLWTSLKRVSGKYPVLLATVASKNRMWEVHSAGALIFL